MKKITKYLEKYRIKNHPIYGSNKSYGNNGAFQIPYQSYNFLVFVSDGDGWEHVSVSLKNRTPNWDEMCYFKDLFWHDYETVIQFHPKKSQYVNNHNHCLHLWRPLNQKINLPSSHLVGILVN